LQQPLLSTSARNGAHAFISNEAAFSSHAMKLQSQGPVTSHIS
jgi:hypothetical protein